MHTQPITWKWRVLRARRATGAGAKVLSDLRRSVLAKLLAVPARAPHWPAAAGLAATPADAGRVVAGCWGAGRLRGAGKSRCNTGHGPTRRRVICRRKGRPGGGVAEFRRVHDMEPRRCKKATTWTYWTSPSTLKSKRAKCCRTKPPTCSARGWVRWKMKVNNGPITGQSRASRCCLEGNTCRCRSGA